MVSPLLALAVGVLIGGFAAWLALHHATETELWMGLNRKHVPNRGLTWEQAVLGSHFQANQNSLFELTDTFASDAE